MLEYSTTVLQCRGGGAGGRTNADPKALWPRISLRAQYKNKWSTRYLVRRRGRPD